MSTSLTVARSSRNALVKSGGSAIARVYVKPAHDGAEIIDRIREASASIADISRFIRVLGPKLDKNTDLPVVEYALARAYYREGRSLSVRQVSLLGTSTHLKTSMEQVRKHMKFLGIAIGEVMTNADASRILCRLNEPDTVH